MCKSPNMSIAVLENRGEPAPTQRESFGHAADSYDLILFSGFMDYTLVFLMSTFVMQMTQ